MTTTSSSSRTDQDGASNSSAPRSTIKWTSSRATSTTSRRTWTMNMDNDFDKNMSMVTKTNDALCSLEELIRKRAKVKGHRRERHMDDQVRHLHQPSARHAND